MSPRALFVTFDGVLQPLGHSQVVRVVTELAKRGFRYDILSLERDDDLAREGDATLQAELARHGIEWHRLPYETGGAKAVAKNVARATTLAARLVATRDVRFVHARAIGGLVALGLQASLRVPYLHDARAYWVDERVDEGRWFTTPRRLEIARRVERRLFRQASAVVTLTQLQRDDLLGGIAAGPWHGRPVVAIPTCADYEDFRLRGVDAPPIPSEIAARVAGKRIVGLVGSINASYRMNDAARLLRSIVTRARDAHILVLSAQKQAFFELLSAAAIPAERFTITSAPHREMPAWLATMDWSVQILSESNAKRGSMPTKLAEFFAAGVRPIHFGCNREVGDWVRRAGTGIVLDSLRDEDLEAAAQYVAASSPDQELIAKGRAITAPHFSLASGVDRYAHLLRAVAPRIVA